MGGACRWAGSVTALAPPLSFWSGRRAPESARSLSRPGSGRAVWGGGAMAPAVDREGYWGPTTSTLDWCEENYTVTLFVAEFCEWGLRRGARARAEGRRGVRRTRRANLAASGGSRPGPGAAAGRARPGEAGEPTGTPVVPGWLQGASGLGTEGTWEPRLGPQRT